MLERTSPVYAVEEQLPEREAESSELVIQKDELAEYERIVALSVTGEKGAIVALYKSRVLDQIASYVAQMVAGAAYWDRAVTKEDIVQMAVCEVLSACTFITVNELKNLLYAAARNNVIDIFRRQKVVKFGALDEAAHVAAGSSLQADLEHREIVCKWNDQLASWFAALNPVDQAILKATLQGCHPRDIARSLYDGDWTRLSVEEKRSLAEKVSRRLYKIKAKLATWVKNSNLAVSAL